ncbi:MFS general substrate transporter [Corynespora cassiicola Philippines]|uniref:MFS general substrate transporter n=1 Tax=Corynespora cassiicola Philippines TaxID=1448308 RepID=A0A2T2NY47_CORCC|nr:MFS general substrate transporter [Corynespora cassiicola Philippines]
MAETAETDPRKPLLPGNVATQPDEPHPPMNTRDGRRSLWPLIVLLILVHLSASLYTLPLNRVIELRLCREHYTTHKLPNVNPDGSIPEKLCKIDPVQKQLAWLQGIMETTLVVCDFVVTIPFSFIAEKYGVRTVLWFNMVPRVFLSVWALLVGNYASFLPTKAIIAGPFLAVLGGECVFQSTIFTLTSALAQEYVQRASYFSYISSTSYVVSFIGPTLAATTMSHNLWSPFWINITLLLLAVPIIRLLPEAKRKTHPPALVSRENADTEETGPLIEGEPSNSRGYSNAFESTGLVDSISQTLRRLIGLIKGRYNFQVLLVSFFLTALASSDTKLLVQYISKRYDWTFAQAGFMLSAKALVNFTLLAIIVPRLIRSSMASKPVHGSEIRLNYLGAMASIIISIVGVLCVALSFKFWMLLSALILYALGSALPVFTMSLVKSPLIALGDSDIQDFSIVMLTKTLGSLVGAPLMTVLWVHAIKIGGAGLGLPYFVSACIYTAAAFVVARLRI